MYTTKNYRTKKELKEAVQAYNEAVAFRQRCKDAGPFTLGAVLLESGEAREPIPITYFQAGPFGGNEPRDGVFCCEGPHYPEPHRWYAAVTAKNGCIVKVK